MNSPLLAIRREWDGTYGLTFGGPNGWHEHTADHVILTVPFSVLRHLDYSGAGFNGVKRCAIEDLGYGANAKLALQFHDRVWTNGGPWGIGNGTSFSDTGYQNSWEVTRAQPGASGILVNYLGSFGQELRPHQDPASYARRFLRQLEPVFPGICEQWNGRATLDAPLYNRWTLGSYSYFKVGQYTSIAGAPGERSGNCHFAGEHCSLDFQGYMEGGAVEGARAANEIISDYM